MSDTFFVSWQLWEQMTFVLATAIVLVFCIGWMRLWWTSRKNRKQVIMDEEKRVRIQDLRISGNIIKLDQDQDEIPFGARALQSGIEIDGIWVSSSSSSTPILESLKRLRESDHSSDSSIGSINDGRPFSLGELTPPRISFSGQLQTVGRATRASVELQKTIESPRSSKFRTSLQDIASAHKPRRSSRLRFSSSGENQVHKDTLSQLESMAPALPQKTHHDRRSHMHDYVVDSTSETAADNECSSGSDSDSSLTSPFVISMSKQPVMVSYSRVTTNKNTEGRDHGIFTSDDSNISFKLSNNVDYSNVTPESPPRRKLAQFATPEASPKLAQMATRIENGMPVNEIQAIQETRWPLLSSSTTESQMEPVFSPGTFHVNKTARKINSGFELLPAGTFNLTTVSTRNVADENKASIESAEGHEKRLSKKLQKKVRNSVARKRASTVSGKA